MDELWRSIGTIRWPLLFSAIMIVALTAWSTWRLTGGRASGDPRTRAWIDAILFWGGFAFVTGVLGTLIGVMVAASAVEAAGEVQAALAWGGIRVALGSSAVGAFILVLASLAWFPLQLCWRLLGTDGESPRGHATG